jgi:Uma2 family endonuclease
MTEKIETLITDEELNHLEGQSDAYWIEVDDGEIIKIERNMTFFHMLIIQNLFRLLDEYIRANDLGYVFIDGGRYILAGKRKGVQRAYQPDLSIMRKGRIPDDFDWQGNFEGAPDLAVEVVSPGQGNPYYLKRISRYFEAGVEEIWLIDPARRELHQYRSDADVSRLYTESDTIEFEKLFPNLSPVMADLFRKPA